MSQFNYLNEINSVLTMDGELNKVPAPRWQKKLDLSTALNGSINTSKLSVSYNNGYSALAAASLSLSNKTPQKNATVNGLKSKKTPNGNQYYF